MQLISDGKPRALHEGGSRHGGFAGALKFQTVDGAAAAGYDQTMSGFQNLTGCAGSVNGHGIADFDGFAFADSRGIRKRVRAL